MMISSWSSQMLLWDGDMSYLSYSAYILNLFCIALFEWRSSEITKCIPITNPGFAALKPLGGLMVPSTKRVPARKF